MGARVGFRVAPGVRLRVVRRGPRMALGPRIARIDDASVERDRDRDRPTDWAARSGGGRRVPPPTRTRARGAGWTAVGDHLDDLLAAHSVAVTHAVPPVAPPPARVERRAVRRDLYRDATGHLGVLDLAGRMAAWRRVRTGVDAEVADRQRAARDRAAAEQADADAWWERLVANDPAIVTERLGSALAEHHLPAVVTAVEPDAQRAHLVIPVATAEKLVGQREPVVGDGGEVTLKRLNKPRRHELFEAAVTSAMVGVAAEAFAVAPGLRAVALAVVCPRHLGGPAVLVLAEVSRDLVLPEGADRPVVADLVSAAEAGRATLIRDKGGRLGSLRPLDPADHDDVAMLLRALERGSMSDVRGQVT